MNPRIKVISLLLLAMTALGVGAASPANASLAPRWKLSGSFLGNGSSSSFSGTQIGTASLQIPSLATLKFVNCVMNGQLKGSAASTPAGLAQLIADCKKAEVEGVPTCEVEPLKTQKLKGELGWRETTGETNVITLTPESGTLVTTISIEGEECAIAGEYPVTGGIIGTLTPTATEVAEATFTVGGAGDTTTTEHWFTSVTPRTTMTSPSLQFGAQSSKFNFQFGVRLNSGGQFSIFGG